MGVKQLKVQVNELTIGMFVAGLDRPWTQTPFPLQGFYIRDMDEVRELKVHCQHVYIDVVKGSSPVKTHFKKSAPIPASQRLKKRRADSRARIVDVAPLTILRESYQVTRGLGREIGRAQQLHQQVYSAVKSVMEHVDKAHQNYPFTATKRAASAMVDSVLRSPDAFTWLSRVRDKDEYTYSHCVRSAVWAILFGRQIGLPKPELDILATGVLLKDIGKTRLPEYLLSKQKRSAVEQSAYERFIEYGVEMLRQAPEIKPRVTSVVKTHCERVNGSGFPQYLRGDKIPLLGKIAGIVTFYDETTHPRGHNSPLSPSKAVAKLYAQRGIEFQEELVVEFIRSIGLYPTGTLIELSNGELAVVVEQNFSRRLKPTVMVVSDALKKRLSKPFVLDLAEHNRPIQRKIDTGKIGQHKDRAIEIVQDLEPGAYGIDIIEIRDAYIGKKTSGPLSVFSAFNLKVAVERIKALRRFS